MKNRKNTEAQELARYISTFVSEYAPKQLTNSPHTLHAYETALTLYVGFLETKCGITPEQFSKECFDHKHIEDWMTWLSEERKCSAKTCNSRLSAIRVFTKYLSSRDIKYLSIDTDAHAVA